MGKRIAIISAIVLISALSILGYFLYKGKKNLLTDPYKLVSDDACIVIETIDIKSFMNSLTTGRGIFGEASKIPELKRFNLEIKYIADQLNKENFKPLFRDGATIISFHPGKEGGIFPMLSMPVQSHLKPKHLREMLGSAGIGQVSEKKVNGHLIVEIPFVADEKTDTAFISLISGLLVFSTSGNLVERACLQGSNINDVRKVPGYAHVLLASGRNSDKIFIVIPNLPRIINPLLNAHVKDLSAQIAKLGSTAEGDIYLNDEGFVLSGYTECADSSDLLFKYKTQPAREFHSYKILPSATVLFETIINHSPEIHTLKDTAVSPETYALAAKLKPFTGDEITRAIIDVKGSPVSDNELIIYELTNREHAEQVFNDISGSGNEILYFQPDEQVKIPVFKTTFNGLVKVFLPDFAPKFDEVYFAFYDRFMIAGNSFQTISRLLYDNLLNKTLSNDLGYRDFENTLPSRAGYYFYCVPSRITDYLAGFLREDIIVALQSNRNSLDKIQAAGYKFSASNGMIYNSFSVSYKEEPRQESTTEWETLLDTVASIKPFFFTNHITGAREIFIQDMNNNIYLINAAGRVLWKVPLNERIISDVYMIDYYRNGKYQLLFSGRNNLHMVDRNGNYVERYPVKFRSPAANPMVLFDYDNNLNYRILVAGEDKLIYSYDKSGNIVKGWNNFRTSGTIRGEINYFREAGKDYLVAADESSMYFLDRTGNKRINLNEAVTKAPGSAMRLNNSSDPSVVFSAPDGTIQQVHFDGSIKKFSLGQFSENHSFDVFDIDGDGFAEYIFIDKGTLYLYNHNREEVFRREFGSDLLGGPINFIFSATDRKIGVIDIKKNLIYLIGKDGTTMNGFPLKGASMFSIGRLADKSGWHLIVGGTDRFLYNYRIDSGN